MRPARVLILLSLALALIAPGATIVAAEDRSAPEALLARLLAEPLPTRDPVDLAHRFRGVPLPATAEPKPQPQLGSEQTFSILNQGSAQLFEANATLRLITNHVYWYVQTDMAANAPQADLERSAKTFEEHTYPLIHAYFGSEPTPGVDGDPHIVLLLANVPGVAAYFSSVDAYPRSVNPRSNEREMIYVNLNAVRPGNDGFDSTLTHEFQHMVHFARCPGQEGWLDEGASELAMRIAGYPGSPPLAFANRPDVQLNSWSSQATEVMRHYQAAYLFLRYAAERGGGWDALPRILAACARGEAQFGPDFDNLFGDWTVANLVQDPKVADGRFAYAGGTFRITQTGGVRRDTPFEGSVAQYAADYVSLPTAQARIRFTGQPTVSLVTPSTQGGVWWSNRGDTLDSRLTRSLDLRAASQATARFRVSYDLEDHFDYVYLTVSTDGGSNWQIVPGTHTQSDHDTGNNFGQGWTGSTDGAWLQEQVDLSPFAGKEVLLRFEYVTDQANNGEGFSFADFEVPQIDLHEPGVAESAWQAEGWVRLDGDVPERWLLHLVGWTADGVHVDPVSVGEDGTATFDVDPTATRSTLVIAPAAPRTSVPAAYQVEVVG